MGEVIAKGQIFKEIFSNPDKVNEVSINVTMYY